MSEKHIKILKDSNIENVDKILNGYYSRFHISIQNTEFMTWVQNNKTNISPERYLYEKWQKEDNIYLPEDYWPSFKPYFTQFIDNIVSNKNVSVISYGWFTSWVTIDKTSNIFFRVKKGKYSESIGKIIAIEFHGQANRIFKPFKVKIKTENNRPFSVECFKGDFILDYSKNTVRVIKTPNVEPVYDMFGTELKTNDTIIYTRQNQLFLAKVVKIIPNKKIYIKIISPKRKYLSHNLRISFTNLNCCKISDDIVDKSMMVILKN